MDDSYVDKQDDMFCSFCERNVYRKEFIYYIIHHSESEALKFYKFLNSRHFYFILNSNEL